MKADVQYNDYIGTSAADISDHTDLDKFLTERGVDTERYESFGASFYSGYSDFFTASIICRDKLKTTEIKPYIVEFDFDITKDEFFELFKRFHVVITEKFDKHSNREIDENISLLDSE
ncbi:hypothetical protein ACM55K_07890 [Flavobacterium sp. LT1R49]|uniref:hypothetical protein n=1 Tax=Flavobacterium arabinosi TaxID=3398737 RepID=UPI003A8C78A8